MKPIVAFALMLVLFGCGPDKALLMETKFDAGLRMKVTELNAKEKEEELQVFGKCNTVVDGHMRQMLIDAGADVHTMNKDIFTARVSSKDIYSIAALDFVLQLQLSQVSKPLNK